MPKNYIEKLLSNLDPKELEELTSKAQNKLWNLDDSDPENSEFVAPGEYADLVEERRKKWGKFAGFSTGFGLIDGLTNGFEVGELAVFGGSSGLGKTYLMLYMASAMAKEGHLVTFITMELTQVQVAERLARIDDNWQELGIMMQKKDFISANDVSQIVESAKAEGSDVIMIDYLQLLTIGTSNNEHLELTQLVQKLKKLAIKHKVLIFLISSLNRAGQKEEELTMHSLKGSGSIEYFADVILLAWRGEETEYGRETFIKLEKSRSRPVNFDDNVRTLYFKDGKFSERLI